MRVAFITVGDTARLTGGYLYHREVFSRLRARGLEIAEIVASGAGLAAQLAAQQAFGKVLRPERYDLVVVDALARGVCAPWLDGWRALRPLLAMVHELQSVAGALEQAARERELEAGLLRADLLIAVSPQGGEALRARGVAPERLRIVSPGFDRLGPRLPASAERRPALRQQQGRAVALCVAQWIPRKGLTTLVDAWARRARPGARLELVGETDADAGYAGLLRARIAEAGEAGIVVRGALSDAELARAYAQADLFVLPSRYEGYGMAFAEAMACGLPIIATDAGPLPWLIGPDAGLLTPPDDARALDAALTHLLADAALRERMGEAARRRASELPRWDDAAAAFLAALELARAGGGPYARASRENRRC